MPLTRAPAVPESGPARDAFKWIQQRADDWKTSLWDLAFFERVLEASHGLDCPAEFEGASYAGGGGNDPLYRELGHMVTNLDSVSALTDDNGAVIGFNPGVNGGSIAGLPGVSIEQLFANLAKYKEIGR